MRKILPVGVGAVALIGASALIWQAADPTAVIESSNREAAVSPPISADVSSKQTVPDATASEPFTDDSSTVASQDNRIVEPAAAASLSEATAKATVARFYDRVASRSWEEARSLLDDSLARSLEPNFFYQFANISVDDLRIVQQSPDAINVVVENTYVYLDGTSQREERSYTVEIIDNQPTITDTTFEKIIKTRS